uniref:Plastid light harvesting protein n=1 Tax=Corethron hystrix TaxID=216773 RepID=A0A7S1BIY6_9STRA|mmetsp:Transcript_28060/g.64236  ORF Transcript_28060/g.64236 Transcript_28060/m.64236 type:complete len:255 (+) Transcript_28060:90-854(+)|eukprot:CAMPEP_0113309656 /NCGR_PEP_ID=MMETSP0010_2-20120614/7612_1 /TAXON_ID=216773 ORGANISM="Corethron hystrix, Strain 308" /NCGR_SAMPLE_ID=MMETSP0010_2 /ASSEMBLY_ACC=CAM_ASM_000155 /LENGTH=254 /DNA_ID=CAMNT_0000164951 /DNA_START=34 /DNA_END=798 /DNA_ORIENTATION=- /assembly_acc=CAM_ASM_000155
MMKLAVLSALLGSAAAFTTSTNSLPSIARSVQKSSLNMETKADLEVLAKKCNPVIGFYDPIGLSDAEFWGYSNEATIGWIRHAEIKHGRIAMFAFVGYIAAANGVHFPWAMQLDGTPFPDITNPPALWDAVSDDAKTQIFGVIFFLEWWSEFGGKHYMAGGKPGDFPDFKGAEGMPHYVPFNFYDPFGFSKNMSEEKKESRLVAEINNGRLAMIGILGFLAEQTTPGSVPALSSVVQHYDGEPMAPFVNNYLIH